MKRKNIVGDFSDNTFFEICVKLCIAHSAMSGLVFTL